MRLKPLSSIKWNSLHTKLLVTYWLLTVLGTSLMAGFLLQSLSRYFIQMRQTDLENWTTAISESVADELEQQNIARVQEFMQRYGKPETITLRVLSPQGQLLASSAQTDRHITNWLAVPGVQEALQNRTVQGTAKGIFSGDDRLYVARPIWRNGQFLGVLRMSVTLEQFQQQFSFLWWTVIGTLLLTMILCAVISDRLARSVSIPIQTMRNFAIRLGSGHFGDKLSIRQSNELDELANELNRMSERLASLDQERRTFLANVSHELRTPISNIQVTVEALQNGAVEEPNLRDRFFQTIEDETRRLARLIHDLLDLGRLEAGATVLEQQRIDLRQLIDRAVRAVETRMQMHHMSFHLNIARVSLVGDPERLLQALLNILDNAIKYFKEHSQVSITGTRDGQHIIIIIQDQGPGIEQTALPRIFEQFYTGDPSRKGSSTGLGLAIAQRIIQAHEGTITASSTIGQGTKFTICLPVRSMK
ncbi:sensor histidine kinase [Leptolyngbya sp. GGD]|uniref:sensor histidine kinase n=1 Tax=Leptolyngbya sp. GGD TaxID=2997907 RepID=UPI00227B31BA|nr:ATP-binding protein [Leptolyngbya sp. GGD]MCY6493979.1 ATP-binding protein [Leptolyngbya sp. GGD]